MRFFYILIFLLISNNVRAELPLPAATTPELPTKTIESLLENLDEVANGLGNEDNYKKSKMNGVSFADLPSVSKDFFFIWQAEEFSILLFETKNKWMETLPKVPEAQKEAMLNYITKLSILRKKHALKYETLIDKACENHKDKMTPKEIIHLKNRVKVWHDAQKLVDRI
jgi:hypothetical protein